jgi:hypothetical protein
VDQPAAARLGVSEPNHSMSVFQIFPAAPVTLVCIRAHFSIKGKEKSA